MEEETDRLSNLCTDLVSLKRLEPALVHLFRHTHAGEWISVAELYRIAGAHENEIKPELAATWLASPSGQSGYALILFCDEELQWSMTAYHNVDRLFRDEASPVTSAAN